MTFDVALMYLVKMQEDYQIFYDEVWQDPESFGICAESLKVAIDTMRKYQEIKEIMSADLEHIHPLDRDKYIVASIKEVLKNGKNN